MNTARIVSLLGCAALAGSLSAQPVFRLRTSAVAEPGMWFLSGEPVQQSEARRSFLGVGVAEISPERAKALKLKEERGVEITRVQDDSPAAKAGLKVGDVVLEYQGQRVEGTEQFIRLVRETPVGRTVEILVQRDGSPVPIKAAIGAMDRQRFPDIPRIDVERLRREIERMGLRGPDVPKVYMSWRTSVLGIEVESLTSQLAEYFGVKEGVLIRSVLRDSPAERAGLKAGDVIVKAGEDKVSAPRDLSTAVRSQRSKKTIPFTVMRDRKELTLNVTVGPEELEKGKGASYRFSMSRSVPVCFSIFFCNNMTA